MNAKAPNTTQDIIPLATHLAQRDEASERKCSKRHPGHRHDAVSPTAESFEGFVVEAVVEAVADSVVDVIAVAVSDIPVRGTGVGGVKGGRCSRRCGKGR